MSSLQLFTLAVLVSLYSSSVGLAQRFAANDDFGRSGGNGGLPDLRQLVGRGRAVPVHRGGGDGASSSTRDPEEVVEPVAILKQINE